MRSLPPLLALPALLALTACGGGDTTTAEPVTYAADSITVLENAQHPPQLCGVVAESLPPQCTGPDVVGWDWSKVRHERHGGTKWGRYRVVGTWDGSKLTLTEPPGPAAEVKREEPRFDTPCPAPEGGWRPVDPAKATQAALETTQQRLNEAEGVGGVWLDQSYLDAIPGYDDADPAMAEKYANDPAKLVLNVKFTGDLEGREAWIRQTWGGALCVSQARRSEAELREIQESLADELGSDFVSASIDTVKEQVVAGVLVADEELQRRLDDTYGAGVVRLDGALKPVR